MVVSVSESKTCRFKRRWLVLTGSCILHFITFGTVQSFGLLYAEILRYFNTGKGETGWIPSLNAGLFFGFGPVASLLAKKFGCRVVAMTGSVLIAVGLLSSMFVNNMYLLYLTYGVVAGNNLWFSTTGSGNGLILLSANEIIIQTFETQCKLALGVVSAGGSVGVVMMPILVAYWLDVYGWRGTFAMMSGLSLQGLVCAAIFPSTANKTKIKEQEGSQNEDYSDSDAEELKKIVGSGDFVVFIIASCVASLGFIVPFVMVPDLAISKGLTTYQSAFIITSAGIAGIVARACSGWIAEFDHVNTLVLHGGVLMIGAGWSVGCVFISSLSLFLVYGVCLGTYSGVFGSLQTVITMEILGKKLFCFGFGILSCFQGVSCLIGPPIAGWIADASGSYNEALYFTASVLFTGCLLSFYIPLRSSILHFDYHTVNQLRIKRNRNVTQFEKNEQSYEIETPHCQTNRNS